MNLSISEARRRLPALVRRAQRDAGASVQITVHDEVVAELRAVQPEPEPGAAAGSVLRHVLFYACLDPKDVNHARARALAVEAATSRTAFCSTWDIVSETVTLLRYRRNFRAALGFLDEVKPGLRIIRYGDRVRMEAADIFRQYGRDHRLSFCDAISFVVVTTLLENMPCLAFDEDFRRLGLIARSRRHTPDAEAAPRETSGV